MLFSDFTKLYLKSMSLVPVREMVSCCTRHFSRCFSTSAQFTVPFRVSNCGSVRNHLLKPCHRILGCQRWCERYTLNSVTSLTMHSSSCSYLATYSTSKSRLLSSCHQKGDVVLQQTLSKFSAVSKHVHSTRTVGLSQTSYPKNYQRWSICRIVQQLVRNVSWITCILLCFIRAVACTEASGCFCSLKKTIKLFFSRKMNNIKLLEHFIKYVKIIWPPISKNPIFAVGIVGQVLGPSGLGHWAKVFLASIEINCGLEPFVAAVLSDMENWLTELFSEKALCY